MPADLVRAVNRACQAGCVNLTRRKMSRGGCQNPGVNRGDPGGPQGMVRVLRVRAGLTQEQLSELSGLSVRAISDIERGTTTRPRRSSIALLEAALRQFGGNGDAPSAAV